LAEILTIGDRDVFLVVDLQNDFCPGGKLAVDCPEHVCASDLSSGNQSLAFEFLSKWVALKTHPSRVLHSR
jgi:nicotinamidase-related amidase